MHAAIAVAGSASTILTHLFGRVLRTDRRPTDRVDSPWTSWRLPTA